MTTSPIVGAAHASPLRLRRVSNQPARLARIPFLVILSLVLVGGMVGVLILNTAVQNQSRALRDAQNQAATLANEQAALQTQVDQMRSVTYLQQAASALGMRPNPNQAVLQLPSGTIEGAPAPAPDNALPDQVWHGAVVQPEPPQISIAPPPAQPKPSASAQAASGPVSDGGALTVPSPAAEPTSEPASEAAAVEPAAEAAAEPAAAEPTAATQEGDQ